MRFSLAMSDGMPCLRLREGQGSADTEQFFSFHGLALLYTGKFDDPFPHKTRAALVHRGAFEFLIRAAIAKAHQHVHFVRGDPQLDFLIHAFPARKKTYAHDKPPLQPC
jgi:hypothetical protein